MQPFRLPLPFLPQPSSPPLRVQHVLMMYSTLGLWQHRSFPQGWLSRSELSSTAPKPGKGPQMPKTAKTARRVFASRCKHVPLLC
eukprot:9222460-Pyramimonas_sp.AAC.1